jgi:hypothetical protein
MSPRTNQPPQTPFIEAEKIVWKGAWWWFNVTVNDPEGDVIYLYWDVFNVCPNKWDEPLPVNEKIRNNAISNESGAYTIRMKAKDPYRAESDWATFKVIVVKSKAESLADISLFWEPLFQRFPNAFTLLRQLMGY